MRGARLRTSVASDVSLGRYAAWDFVGGRHQGKLIDMGKDALQDSAGACAHTPHLVEVLLPLSLGT